VGSALLARGQDRAATVVREPVCDGWSPRTVPGPSEEECLFVLSLVRHWWELCLGWGIGQCASGGLMNVTVQQQNVKFMKAPSGLCRAE